jgi:hypothetical protein
VSFSLESITFMHPWSTTVCPRKFVFLNLPLYPLHWTFTFSLKLFYICCLLWSTFRGTLYLPRYVFTLLFHLSFNQFKIRLYLLPFHIHYPHPLILWNMTLPFWIHWLFPLKSCQCHLRMKSHRHLFINAIFILSVVLTNVVCAFLLETISLPFATMT